MKREKESQREMGNKGSSKTDRRSDRGRRGKGGVHLTGKMKWRAAKRAQRQERELETMSPSYHAKNGKAK